MYYFLKLGFLVWLFHPRSKGATIVYNNYLKEAAEDAAELLKKRVY